MIIDIKTNKKPSDGSIAVYQDGEWKAVGKSAYLQPYMRRNDETESGLKELRKEFESLKKQYEALVGGFANVVISFADMKEAFNEKLAEYHAVLRVLTDGE